MARWQLSPTAYRRITLFALVALCVIIVSGAAVRLTGSGLGCPDWPHCDSERAVEALDSHAWVEFGNRLFTGVVSIAVALAVLGALIRRPRRRDLTWLSVGLVVGVLAQIVLGAVVVRTDLVPAAVSAHFLVSMALVADAVVLHDRARSPERPARLQVAPIVRNLAAAATAVAVVVLTTGTVVTGAGPHSGDPGVVERITVDVPTVARVHGGSVVLFLSLTVATIVAAVRTGSPHSVLVRAEILLGVLVAQAAVGYTQYFTGVPVLLVAVHVTGAVLVWIAVLELLLGSYRRDAADPGEPATAEPSLVSA